MYIFYYRVPMHNQKSIYLDNLKFFFHLQTVFILSLTCLWNWFVCFFLGKHPMHFAVLLCCFESYCINSSQHVCDCSSWECDILSNLLQAQILMAEWQFLPSLLQLHGAHTKLQAWYAATAVKEVQWTCHFSYFQTIYLFLTYSHQFVFLAHISKRISTLFSQHFNVFYMFKYNQECVYTFAPCSHTLNFEQKSCFWKLKLLFNLALHTLNKTPHN